MKTQVQLESLSGSKSTYPGNELFFQSRHPKMRTKERYETITEKRKLASRDWFEAKRITTKRRTAMGIKLASRSWKPVLCGAVPDVGVSGPLRSLSFIAFGEEST